MQDMVLVLNFDDNASRALARKLRSERIMCRLVPGDTPLEDIQAQEPLGLLLAGGATGRSPSGMDARLPGCGLPILALGDAARLMKVEPEIALNGAVNRFIARFERAEAEILTNHEEIESLEANVLRKYWNSVKL